MHKNIIICHETDDLHDDSLANSFILAKPNTKGLANAVKDLLENGFDRNMQETHSTGPSFLYKYARMDTFL
jgi:hypothetical protein